MGLAVETGRQAILFTMVTATMVEGHEKLEECTGGVHGPILLWCIREGFLEEKMSMWGPEGGTENDVGTS